MAEHMLHEEQEEIFKGIEERAKQRSSVVGSTKSKIGYAWDVVRNLIVIGIILAVYNAVYDYASIIIISILILIYITIVSIGAQISQSLTQTNLRIHAHSKDILSKLGEEEDDASKEDFERAGFILEKTEYKFFLNSAFNFAIFLIVLFNLWSAL